MERSWLWLWLGIVIEQNSGLLQGSWMCNKGNLHLSLHTLSFRIRPAISPEHQNETKICRFVQYEHNSSGCWATTIGGHW